MKNLKKILTAFAMVMLSLSFAKSETPRYSLSVKNISNIDSRTLEFDIYLKHLNPSSSVFKYISTQLILQYNPSFANGGNMTYTFYPGDTLQLSDLPFACRPRNPKASQSELRLAGNNILPLSMIPEVSSVSNGTKIIRMRLQTSASSFSGDFGLSWKNNQSAGIVTKVLALDNNKIVDATDSASHNVNSSSGTSANIRLALQGLYNPDLNNLNSADTVTVYLRNIASPFEIVDNASAVVNASTLTANFTFANVQNGTYYIVIQQRNSLETWSKTGGESITSGASFNFDFTTAASQAYGNNQIQIGSKYCIFSGDVNQDDVVDLTDVQLIDNDVYNFVSGYVSTDLNGDDFVDLSDILIADNNGLNYVSIVSP